MSEAHPSAWAGGVIDIANGIELYCSRYKKSCCSGAEATRQFEGCVQLRKTLSYVAEQNVEVLEVELRLDQ
jgi:hypothetical protein